MRSIFFLVWWDKFSRSLVLAVRSLWLHKLRAFLSVLGIIIGVAAVIALMAFGEGSMQDALADIARQGATHIIVKSVKPTDVTAAASKAWVANYGLTDQDYKKMQMINTVGLHVPMRIFAQEIRNNERAVNGRVVGTTANYALVNSFTLAGGRFLVAEDDETFNNVCVLGSGIAEALFPFDNPVGQAVSIGNVKFYYKIVGVMSERSPYGSSSGKAAEEFNNDVYMPLSTCQSRFGEKVIIRQAGSRSGEQVELHQITLKIKDMSEVRDAGEAVKNILATSHDKNDWDVTIPLDRLEEAERTRDRYLIFLAFIGTISLVVGGIGIMNIMLATVTERTREIGVRRALGAKQRDITMQFIIEAVVQTTVGGVIGMLVGFIIVFGIPLLMVVPVKLHVPWTIASFFVSVAIGVVFGWYPAYRASRLDPIEALRHV